MSEFKPLGAQFVTYLDRLMCTMCGATYVPAKAETYTCSTCGPDEGILNVTYDMAAVGRDLALSDLLEGPQNHWRYGPLLPVTAHHLAADWPIGWSPVTEAPLLAQAVGVKRLRLKDDGRNPTGSIEDRASSIGVVRAAESGAKAVACASTGPAAASLAACSAMASLPAHVFLPQESADDVLGWLRLLGATVFRVAGRYEDAYRLCNEACERFGWYNHNAAYNPYLIEGKKTGGLEIAEQCLMDPPAWLAVSAGHGCNLAAIAKGLRQMRELELIDWMPRILGVQAQGVDPMARAFETGTLAASTGGTIARGIDRPRPRNWRQAVEAVRASEGAFVTVTDEAILAAQRDTARLAGIVADPGAAAAVAGVAEAVQTGVIGPRESVLIYVTGSIPKCAEMSADIGGVYEVPPSVDAVAATLSAAS